MASAAGNRMLGAAIGAAGVATGNAQLASAGARSVLTGQNAIPGAAASVIEKGRDAGVESKRKLEAAKKESLQDAKRKAERDENRRYMENQQKQRQTMPGQQNNGQAGGGDPRAAGSGGKNAQQPAQPFDATSNASSVPQGTRQPQAQQSSPQTASTPSHTGQAENVQDPRRAGSDIGSMQSQGRADVRTSAPERESPATSNTMPSAPIENDSAPSLRTPGSATVGSSRDDVVGGPVPDFDPNTRSRPTVQATPAETAPPATPSPAEAPANEPAMNAQATPMQEAPTAQTMQATTQPEAGAAPPHATQPAAQPSAPALSTDAQRSASQPARSQALGAYTPEGNAALRMQGVSAEKRDQQAVSDYHAMLNPPNSNKYISREQAQWDLQKRGMLPSQRDHNEKLVSDYAAQNGVGEREAYQTLDKGRQLAQYQQGELPRPMSYASEADERAVQSAVQRQYEEQRSQSQRLGMPEPTPPGHLERAETHARMRNNNELPSQQAPEGDAGKTLGSDGQGAPFTAAPEGRNSAPSKVPVSILDQEIDGLPDPAPTSANGSQSMTDEARASEPANTQVNRPCRPSSPRHSKPRQRSD